MLSDEEKGLALRYEFALWAGSLYDEKYGDKHVKTRAAKKRIDCLLRNSVGANKTELAKRCYLRMKEERDA